jgi:thiol-disulfide isomerase/thioredoxin
MNPFPTKPTTKMVLQHQKQRPVQWKIPTAMDATIRPIPWFLSLRPTTATAATTTTISSSSKSNTNDLPIAPVGKFIQQSTVLDGPEWISVRNRLLLQQNRERLSTEQQQLQQPYYSRTKVGIFTICSGSIQGERVVGMQLRPGTPTSDDDATAAVPIDHDSSIQLYPESIAKIPDKITEMDAVWTMIQSLSMIHCVRPVMSNIGGSGTVEFLQNGSIAIVGSNSLSIQAAQALYDTFHYNVTIVATSNKPNANVVPQEIHYLQPCIEQVGIDDGGDNSEEDETSKMIGFSSVLHQFDALLDTIGHENNDNDGAGIASSTICKNLAELHNCHVYISTVTESQRIIFQDGLLFGPKKTKEHVAQIVSRAPKTTAAFFPSPVAFGSTVEALLQKGVTFAAPSKPTNSYYVRSWSLKDFWEYTTWPRDAASNIRFGFPDLDRRKSALYELDDEDEDDDGGVRTMISAPPLRSVNSEMFQTKPENFVDESDPFVLEAKIVSDLERIVRDKTTCVVFVSAPFCRTCRYLKPQFQRLARQYSTNSTITNSDAIVPATPVVSDSNTTITSSPDTNGLLFIKAEASGQIGKDIGRALGIDTVPTFILYKNGRRYGTPITSITRLPSKKLESVIDAMQKDIAWNEALFQQDESSNSNNRSKLT